MSLTLASIVEGHGEVEALPVLLRRILQEIAPGSGIQVCRPHRAPRGDLLRPEGLEKRVELLSRQLSPPWSLLVLLDADDDCPARLGPDLLHRLGKQVRGCEFGVVLANREFENWFLAALSSLHGKSGLQEGLSDVADAEAIRGAKERMTRFMERRLVYSPSKDQAKLAAGIDLALARTNSASFDKLWREVTRLIRPSAASVVSS